MIFILLQIIENIAESNNIKHKLISVNLKDKIININIEVIKHAKLYE
jgi:hypothetical protein